MKTGSDNIDAKYPQFVMEDERKYWDDLSETAKSYFISYYNEFEMNEPEMAAKLKEEGRFTLFPVYSLMIAGV